VQVAGSNGFPRVPIPVTTEFLEEEPLYVNAKQYRRILKRRHARAKLEAEGKIPKERPVSNIFLYFVLVLHQTIFLRFQKSIYW